MPRPSLAKKWILYYAIAFLLLAVTYALKKRIPGAGPSVGVYLVVLVTLLLAAAGARFWISRHPETKEDTTAESKEETLRAIAERALRGRKH
jgi:hypothetical protein